MRCDRSPALDHRRRAGRAASLARRRRRRNRAIDVLRREQRLTERARLLEARVTGTGSTFPDERLELVFLCCHPALAPEARVALTLRAVGGLDTAEIARAFLSVRRR